MKNWPTMRPRFLSLPRSLAIAASCCLLGACAPQPGESESIRLYALDCGRIEINLENFTEGNEYDEKKRTVIASAFLIRHPRGDLIWDAGLPDAFSDSNASQIEPPAHMSVPVTMASQLAVLDLGPNDIEYFSVSHSHFDHLGNANLLSSATFLVDKDERAHMFRQQARTNGRAFPHYSKLEHAKTIEFDGDYDVFGDGSVTILEMPGHTPGHTTLQLKLNNTGPILLSGDLYHFEEARLLKTVPKFNTDVARTLDSMDRFEVIAKSIDARVVIQHSLNHFRELPPFPEYLD